ncbi:hypothetical protein PR048_015903 [Dryococelus australis]|uniref:Uncharacterized protein n=1 Tax=Dryococelus australis TaxID=614101 RepID=A0ABQ9HIS1_9NEOP|nr:hypothetical protein PR048_015903 [Dryococelus australis]
MKQKDEPPESSITDEMEIRKATSQRSPTKSLMMTKSSLMFYRLMLKKTIQTMKIKVTVKGLVTLQQKKLLNSR